MHSRIGKHHIDAHPVKPLSLIGRDQRFLNFLIVVQLQVLPNLAHLLLELVNLGEETGFVELLDLVLQCLQADATDGLLRVVFDGSDFGLSLVAVDLLVAHVVEQILDPLLCRRHMVDQFRVQIIDPLVVIAHLLKPITFLDRLLEQLFDLSETDLASNCLKYRLFHK